MPLTFAVFTGPDQVKMKWRETYLTEGLDRKLAVVVPRGIYQGFRLVPVAVNLTVRVEADPASGISTAVYQTSDGYSLTLRAATFDLDLTPLAGTADPVIIAIDADYAVGVTTTATMMVYTQAEFAALPAVEQEEKIILGEVLVPLAGLIPAVNITPNRRREAWEFVAPGSRPWLPLLKNPSFEWSVDNENSPGSTAFWGGQLDSPTHLNFIPTSTYPTASGNRSLIIRKILAGVTPSAVVFQRLGLPVQPGQRVKLRLSKRVLIALTAGSIQAGLNLADANGQGVTFVALTIPAAVPDAAWVTLEQVFEIPAGSYFIDAFGIGFIGADFAANGDAVLFDDVQCWLEAPGDDPTLWPVWTSEITIGEQNQSSAGLADLAAHFRFDRGTPTNEGTLVIERRDQQDGSALPPLVELMGRLKLGQAGSLGATDATALLARAGAVVATGAGVKRTLLFESQGSAPKQRVYLLNPAAAVADGIEITDNAAWNGTQWVKDVAGTAASKLSQMANGLSFFTRLAANNANWNDSGPLPRWDRQSALDETGNAYVDSTLLAGYRIGQTSSDDDAVTQRMAAILNAPATSTYVLLVGAFATGGQPQTRIYAAGNGSLLITTNARWGSSGNPTDAKWNKDVAGVAATVFMVGLWPYGGNGTGLLSARRFTDAAWTDAEWEEFPLNLLGAGLLVTTPNSEMTAGVKIHVKPPGALPPVTATRTLMFEFAQPTGGVAQGATRFYSTPAFNGMMEITTNARWDEVAGLWVTDVTGPAARWALVSETVATDPGGPSGRASLIIYTTMPMGPATSFPEANFQKSFLSLHSPVADPAGLTTRVMELFGANGTLLGDGGQLPIFSCFAKAVGSAYGLLLGQFVVGGAQWPHLFVFGPSGFGLWPGMPPPLPPGPVYINAAGVIIAVDNVGAQVAAAALAPGPALTSFNANIVAW